uniref:Uncharacterized protein n=1 Tax=Candidatus Methanophagaceae archaeon ANME-1 ERB6 TaxID=2759912 RepID=A0A7G9YWK0_9EURY|nr:hypothetical protein IAKEDICC_00004 [Methanosarcinales archaeon ANME-1 ERB6]
MKRLRLYLDSTILITFVFGARLEPKRFNDVSTLFHSKNVELVTSLYALIELYNYPIFNFEQEDKEKRLFAKQAILRVLLTEIEIAPMLPRELRSYYSGIFKMDDSSDVPHAISAYVEKCNYVVTYDRHFENIEDKIGCRTPKKVLKEIEG